MSIIIKNNGFYKENYGLIYPGNLHLHLNEKIKIEEGVEFKDILYYLSALHKDSFIIADVLKGKYSFLDLLKSLNVVYETINYQIKCISLHSWIDIWGKFGDKNPQEHNLSFDIGSCLVAKGEDGDDYGLENIPFGYLMTTPFVVGNKNIYIAKTDSKELNLCGNIKTDLPLLDFLEVLYKELTHLKGLMK